MIFRVITDCPTGLLRGDAGDDVGLWVEERELLEDVGIFCIL